LADAQGYPWFPRPLHLRVHEALGDRFALPLLRPSPQTARTVLSSLPAGMRPLTAPPTPEHPEEPREDEGELLIDRSLLGDILAGDAFGPRAGSLRSHMQSAATFAEPEPRPGLAMTNATNTATPGRLFARPYRRYRGALDPEGKGFRNAGFVAWFRVPGLDGHEPAAFDGTGFLGGDRRRALFRFQPQEASPLLDLQEKVADAVAESAGFLLYLLTPAAAPAEGKLTFDGQSPVAAALGRAVAASGWNGSSTGSGTGPRPILTLLPAGSVFFFEWSAACAGAPARRAFAAKHWLASLSPAYRNGGFGRVLLGVWPR
jgi:hypothetical protein